MTTELVVLLSLFAFIVIGGFMGDKGPKNVFFNSAPRLAARVETQLATGRGFQFGKNRKTPRWEAPTGTGPKGMLK